MPIMLAIAALCASWYVYLARKAGASIQGQLIAAVIGGGGFFVLFLVLKQVHEGLITNVRLIRRLVVTNELAYMVVLNLLPVLVLLFALSFVVRDRLKAK